MASENLVKELWEIIQKENKEEISYNDFEKDLNKVLNLPKDESDRAISLMISQAEVNPNLIGEYKGGSFMISPSFAAVITSTIKYENQFIPGKEEYNNRIMGEGIKEAVAPTAFILSPHLFDSMIENYDELSENDVEELWSNYSDLSSNDKSRLIQAHNDRLRKKLEDPNISDEEKDAVKAQIEENNKRDAMQKAAETGDPFVEKKLRDRVKAMQARNPELFKEVFPEYEDIDALPMDVIKALCDVDDQYTYAQQRNENYYERNNYHDKKARFFDAPIDKRRIFQTLKNFVKGKDRLNLDEKLEMLFMTAERSEEHIEILKEPEDFIYYMGLLDNVVKETGVSEASYIETLFEAMKAIRVEKLEDGSYANIAEELYDYFVEHDADPQMFEFLTKFNASKLSALVYEGFREDRDGVIAKVLDPYLKGKQKGETLEIIVQENFPDVDGKRKEEIVESYRNKELINTNKAPINVAGINIEELKELKEKKYITETELESGIKGKEEDFVVDRDGLTKAKIAIEKSGDREEPSDVEQDVGINNINIKVNYGMYTDLTSTQIENPEESGFDFDNLFDQPSYNEGRNTTGLEEDKTQETKSESESVEVVEESQEVTTQSESSDVKRNAGQPSKMTREMAKSLAQKAMNEQTRLSFFNPKISRQPRKIFSKLRPPFIKTEADLLRDAVKDVEKRTGIKLEADLGEETREE